MMDKSQKIYQKRNVLGPEPRLPVFPLGQMQISGVPNRPEGPSETATFGQIHHQMVERYALPSILVSPDDRIVHFSEHAGGYLQHPGGESTQNVYKLLRPELRIDLRGILKAAREKKEGVRSGPIQVQFDNDTREVVLHARPAQAESQEGYALIIFDEESLPPREPRKPPAALKPDLRAKGDSAADELRSELDLTRQRLQSIIEEYETGQEEMKASNEELQSANEELRSTMEELETSKEELQSMNEELQTVNQENRHKVEQLRMLSSDLQNLLSSTDIATLFLDRHLHILRFTPKLSDLFNVRVTDRGRPILDLTDRLNYADLESDAQAVLAKLTPVERELQDVDKRWYFTRVLPYRSSEDRIEGVVITFIDITTRKEAGEDSGGK